MATQLDQVKRDLVGGSSVGPTSKPPQWLHKLLGTVPGLPADAVPHNRPKHAELQAAIAEAAYHPAIEACLHLINGDLYSAHFLVRKAQGGSRYLDWLHAILHKLEGDFRNAKMWYTDLGNSNAGASGGERARSSEESKGTADVFRRFHAFWLVPATNGGAGQREKGGTLDLESLNDLPRQVQLTAHGHIDLVFLTTLAQKAATSSAVGSDAVQRDIEKHHRSTTEAEDKIKASQSAFALDELQSLFEKLVDSESAQKAVRGVTQLELLWMLSAMVEDFGWRHYGMADAVEALKVESTPAHQSLDDDRKSKASNMVFNPSQGQRIF
ncbi:hypothetical protein PSEUBRA_001133 [Kalmanozyma brasiliensis GHG001]|uniref:uncharacterized protein n=1 Tax=Kalmanozyma brasiliensis (strain GHG001) TaxID=1365824 RepID=UPI00286809C9|nr:uncharacterized protein PSEUBRA_001133 [Kalmanozyma brasiliensis GHG001]EST09182.2 hypothetical protein PSEUBRA_001133 [Kalmanozyma brasiliensis GHG001]